MSPAAEGIIRRLDATRQKWWFFTLLTTCVLAVCASLGTLLVFMLSDAYLRFPWFVLVLMFLVWLGVTGGLIYLVSRRLLRNQRSLEATARRVEAEYPDLGSNLINVVQLATDTKNENRAFCEAAINQGAARVGYIPFDAAAQKQSRWRRFLYCMQTPRDLAESSIILCVLIGLAVLCQWLIPSWGSAANRLLKSPWGFVPSVGRVKIEVKPGDFTVLEGSNLEITGLIENPDGTPYKATLFVTREGENEAGFPMVPGQDDKRDASEKKEGTKDRFTFTIPSITRPLQYRLEIGDSQTPIYKVQLRDRPTIERIEVTYRYPSYLGRKEDTHAQRNGDLEAPQYTRASVKIHLSIPIDKGLLQFPGGGHPGRVESSGTVLAVDDILLEKDTTYTIQLYTDSSHRSPANTGPRVNRVRVLPDEPPKVKLVKPAAQSSATPGSSVPVAIRASDDHGLGRLQLEMKVQQTEPEAAQSEQGGDEKPAPAEAAAEKITVLQQWHNFEGNVTSAERDFPLELTPEVARPGQTVFIRAVATDKRQLRDRRLKVEPQETPSGWHAVRVMSEEAKSASALQQLDSLRAAIWKLIEKQNLAHARAQSILTAEQAAERTNRAGGVRVAQVDIQKAANDLAQAIAEGEADERLAVKRILGKLALGEMLAAVKQCDEMVKLPAADDFQEPVGELRKTQERIIDILRKLLNATRQAENDALAEMKKRPGGDLPDESKKKFEEMRNKLDEFLKQQKKVIEASENLAKTPVEDFTEADEQKLRELAAAEDEWAKFMKELQTDLSKLPEQDFANSSMAKELVEIQTELKMAEDALLKRSADIAVPLEQLGYERAEELKTNMEKWLPDTPDREKWSQEESLTDQDKEAPMAELPGELEDLIGELMEEEEDLFDEMEDVSSSAADSLDKGAGWDVADGPISNMSAKGATGNRLPNTSEIGGRSGEGRSGKSGGEFVGDEAVGKGGRKTPSRLTPDPYVKGQIADHSKDPTGGATGGGKESGQGGKGLEGPEPGPQGQRDLQRLAGRQAALRNKAEGVDLQFQVMNYHRTDLKKMIELMAQIERDLQAGHYQDARRERRVLAEGLGRLKEVVEGDVQVRQDATANLPTDIQREIFGSMQDPSPPGWEELNRQYFERLSGGGARAAAKPEK
jgi:hypothetical protein